MQRHAIAAIPADSDPMHADGQDSRQQHARDEHHRRRGNGRQHARWPHGSVLMSLRRSQRRALDRIEQALVAEDPGLGARFAVFTMLTQDEPMPGTEHVPGRRQRFLHRARRRARRHQHLSIRGQRRRPRFIQGLYVAGSRRVPRQQ
jgi:hypothetical protein